MDRLAQPFAFISGLTEPRARAWVPLRESPFMLGRDADNHLCLADDRSASRYHCQIESRDGDVLIQDSGSANGTYVTGQRVQGPTPLLLPCWITVGHTRLLLVPTIAEADDATELMENAYSSQNSILMPPTAFFEERTEAFLVVDVVNSARLVQRSDVYLAKIMMAMGQTLERSLHLEEQPFLKCTGDGFFACFGSASAALEAGLRLGPRLARSFQQELQISVALHWGSSGLTAEGDRTGKHVHAVFALEKVRHENEALRRELATGSVDSAIVMSEAFWAQLDLARKVHARPLGFHLLKGLDEQVRVFRWFIPPA